MRDGRIDYQRYAEADLLEIYGAIDKARYPLNFENLKIRLREFGYETTDSGELVRVHPSTASAGEERKKASPSWQTLASLALFGVVVVILLLGWYELENGSGDFGPIAAFFVSALFASVLAAVGIWLAYRGSKAEAGSTLASNIAVFAAVFFALGIGFCLFALFNLIS